jgi:hypothetical protein
MCLVVASLPGGCSSVASDGRADNGAGVAATDAPTISAITDRTVAAGIWTEPISITVGDAQTAPGSLTIAATSTTPVLMPAASIAIGRTGANRTITVTPAAGKNGKAVITVTVSDGTLVRNASFVLTVN